MPSVLWKKFRTVLQVQSRFRLLACLVLCCPLCVIFAGSGSGLIEPLLDSQVARPPKIPAVLCLAESAFICRLLIFPFRVGGFQESEDQACWRALCTRGFGSAEGHIRVGGREGHNDGRQRRVYGNAFPPCLQFVLVFFSSGFFQFVIYGEEAMFHFMPARPQIITAAGVAREVFELKKD